MMKRKKFDRKEKSTELHHNFDESDEKQNNKQKVPHISIFM